MKKRGFAAMEEKVRKAIAKLGGEAAQKKGTAHQFTPAEARAAGKKGGKALAAKDPEYMQEIGRRGGRATQRRGQEAALEGRRTIPEGASA